MADPGSEERGKAVPSRWEAAHLPCANAHFYQENVQAGVRHTDETPLSAHVGGGRKEQRVIEHLPQVFHAHFTKHPCKVQFMSPF